MLSLKNEKTSGEIRRQDNPINQWVRLNRFLLFYKYALIVLGTVIFGFIVLTFYLVNRDPLVIALTNHEKLFFFAEHTSVPVTEADVQEFSKLFIKTRYSWASQNPDKLLKELAPLTSQGLLLKIEESLSRNKKALAQSALSQDVLIRTLTLENGRVLAQIDRVIAIGEKMKKELITPPVETGKHPGSVKGIASAASSEEKRERGRASLAMRPANINYRAKQVIERADYSDPSNTLPMGANFVGRLMTSIDTRDGGSFSKIELPYGGSFQGNDLLPQGSILFAGVKYDGNGEKVFLDFHSGVYPDGQEFKIRAQALSARDFSPGIEGDYHGTFSNRVAANLGLTFVSGLTEALIEKESAGNGGAFAPSTTVPKATLKNGLLSGVSKVTDSEAQRMAKELAGKQSFVTVDAGKELIVGLLERFVKGSHSESGNKGR